MKNPKILLIVIVTLVITTIAFFLFWFPWEKYAQVTYETSTDQTDSIIFPVAPGKLSVMSVTQNNGYGYRTVDVSSGDLEKFYFNAPYGCLTASICPGGKEIVGVSRCEDTSKGYGVTRVDLSSKKVTWMPQPWYNVQQAVWSPDGKYVAFSVEESTNSRLPQLGLWNIGNDSVSLCKKIDAAIFAPQWQPGTDYIGCIAQTINGTGILRYSIKSHVWDTILAPTPKLNSMYLSFNTRRPYLVFAGEWEGSKGLFTLNTKDKKVKQIYQGICREPVFDYNSDRLASIAKVDQKDWLISIDAVTGDMKKIASADSACWPQWVPPVSIN